MAHGDDFDDDNDRPRFGSRRHWDDDDLPRRRPRDDDESVQRRPSPKKSTSGLVIGIVVAVFLLICGGGGALVYWAVTGVKKGIEQAQKNMQAAAAEAEVEESRNNLDEIFQAIIAYEAANRTLPHNSYDDQGRPLLSWRVHLLPFMREAELYNKFRLNEPWDSPNNRQLLDDMPEVFHVSTGPNPRGRQTYYRGFCHAGSIFEKPRDGKPAPRFSRAAGIPDGLTITIMVVEAGEPIEWTRPDDLDWPTGSPRPSLGGVNPKRTIFLALMADGTVKRIRRDVNDNTLRQLIDRRDGTPIPPGWEQPGRRPIEDPD
jgi:Protein of unknown function (DUF1559)